MNVRRLLSRAPREVAPEAPQADRLVELADAADREILDRAMPYSMTGAARMLALIDAVRYSVVRDVPGAFAECGVWRGGSVLAMILTLQQLGVADRDIYLYDTFEGMTAPTEEDVSALEPSALSAWDEAQSESRRLYPELFDPSLFSEEGVRSTLLPTGYPEQRLHLVRGAVEDTLPEAAPSGLAILRLDTDWYESTRHELKHLFPLLVSGGVLIVDDYGHWQGARQAVDEYFSSEHAPLLLTRIDYTCRIAVKP